MHLPSLVNLIPFPTTLLYETLTSSCRPSRTSSTHLLPLALYHVIWRQPLSNLCWKKPSLDKNLLKNYRPISNLPFLSNILEKIVLYKHLSHLQENNLSNPFQSAYRAGYSTETVLLRILNDILSALDNDNISVLLFLDLSAAFDTIGHQILLSRLNCFLAFSLLHSSGFTHTSQTDISPLQSITRLRHHHSSMYCVPQGSVLGPILFVLYIYASLRYHS